MVISIVKITVILDLQFNPHVWMMVFVVRNGWGDEKVDCCDGSDEYSGFVSCQNTCNEVHQQWEWSFWNGFIVRKENAARLETFSKGTLLLHEWIEQSKQSLIVNEEKKSRIGDEIAALEKKIEEETEVLNQLKAKAEQSQPQETVK